MITNIKSWTTDSLKAEKLYALSTIEYQKDRLDQINAEIEERTKIVPGRRVRVKHEMDVGEYSNDHIVVNPQSWEMLRMDRVWCVDLVTGDLRGVYAHNVRVAE